MSQSKELARARDLFGGFASQWSEVVSADPSLEGLLHEKSEHLLLSSDIVNVRAGIELLLSFSESSLVRLVDVVSGEFVVVEKYASNRLLLEQSICEAVCSASSEWYELWSLGSFDGMMFRSVGELKYADCTAEMKERLLKESSSMSSIPAGTFMMGALPDDEDAEDCEKPRHEVTISQPFLLGKYAVTQALYESVMCTNPSGFKGATRPVEEVSWCDAVLFCNKLSEKKGLEPVYNLPTPLSNDDGWSKKVTMNHQANGYRLPTEAEWEYAARGEEEHLYAGSNDIDEVAWYTDNSGNKTHPVGQKKGNAFGLYDMTGNVFEWVWDRYGDYFIRVDRGGSWGSSAGSARVSNRGYYTPSYRINSLGFRISRSGGDVPQTP